MHSFPKKPERIAQWRRVLSSSILSFFCFFSFFSFSLFPVLLCFTFVSSSLPPSFAREEPVLCEPVFLLTRWILSRLSWFYLLFFVFSSWHSRTPVKLFTFVSLSSVVNVVMSFDWFPRWIIQDIFIFLFISPFLVNEASSEASSHFWKTQILYFKVGFCFPNGRLKSL